jgi:hypothetical protein
MFKKELPPTPKLNTDHLFKDYELWVDLGFLGIETDYQGNVKAVVIPEKKPRKSKKNPQPSLTPKQKKRNKVKSRFRVKVENAIGGAKRLGAITQVFRNKKEKFNDAVMEVACGLWNFHLDFKGVYEKMLITNKSIVTRKPRIIMPS